MAITKICGVETEYGIVIRGVDESNPIAASSMLINAYLHGVGIHPIGRFGEWKYVNQDGAILSARRVVESVQAGETLRTAATPTSPVRANGTARPAATN